MPAAPRPFRFGVRASALPGGTATTTGESWRDLARRVEDLGFSTLFLPDHFGDQLAPVPAMMAAADATTDLKVGTLSILRSVGKPGYTFTANGTEKLGGVEAAIVDVNAAGERARIWIEPASGRMLRMSTESRATGELLTSVTDYHEWQTFGPVQLPVKATTTTNGTPSSSSLVTNVEIDPPLDPALFRKP